ncbi:MAG: DNA-binding protein [Candidatus Thermoplasmatota archaeon]|nr:DNA-binding protein [Candidatus Thermoplasmatota archaeon]
MPDEDPELEALRQKRLAQLHMQEQQQQVMNEEQSRADAQKKTILRKVLTVDAKERLGRLKLGYPDLANAIENQLILLYQSGRLPGPVDDQTLKRLLSQVQPQKREINIVRK